MTWQATILVTPTLFAVVLAALLSGYGLYQLHAGNRSPVVLLFFWITLATLVWTGFSALKLLHTDPETKLLFYQILHIGAAALPPLLFCFILAYTDRTEWLHPALLGGIFAVPALFVALLFLNPANIVIQDVHVMTNELVLLRVESGPGFLVFLLFSTVFVSAGVGIMLLELRQVGATYYPQAALITLAVLVPLVFGGLNALSVPPFIQDGPNLVPTSAAVSTAALALLLSRYRLFSRPPLAYATAMKYSPDALFVLDQKEQIVHANERGTAILNEMGGQLGETLTKHLSGFNPEADSGQLREVSGRSGETTYQRIVVTPLERGGRFIGWVVLLRDETTQYEQTRLLEEKNDKLEQFSSVVSHDLRNPLGVAQLRLELLQEEVSSDHIPPIERALTRMELLIDDLLALAREGKKVREFETVPLNVLIQRCWENVETGGAQLELNSDGFIRADESRIEQLIENLFRNAIERGGEGVNVTVGELPGGFYIEDDGLGIAPADVEAVFESGYSTTPDGTGLGLYIVQEIVKAHGWEIALTESSTGGARFEITGVEYVAWPKN